MRQHTNYIKKKPQRTLVGTWPSWQGNKENTHSLHILRFDVRSNPGRNKTTLEKGSSGDRKESLRDLSCGMSNTAGLSKTNEKKKKMGTQIDNSPAGNTDLVAASDIQIEEKK